MTTEAVTRKRRQQLDSAQEQAGVIYGKALAGAADAAGKSDEVVAELESVVAEVLDKHPDFERLLESAVVPGDEKVAILERTLGSSVSPLVLNFTKVLAEHGRLTALRAVAIELRRLSDVRHGKFRVHVTTAHALSATGLQQLKTDLSQRFGAEPDIEADVDPALIGGLVLRVGDTVYDGSVARRLERLREQMIHRSVHEIQSRRDRFRHSS